MLTAPRAGHQDVAKFSTNTAAWRVIASDGTGYATIALMDAAGKVPFPNVPPGVSIRDAVFRTETSAGGVDGAGCFVALNRTDANFGDLASDAARDALAIFVGGSGHSLIEPGPVRNVWVRKITGSDIFTARTGY